MTKREQIKAIVLNQYDYMRYMDTPSLVSVNGYSITNHDVSWQLWQRKGRASIIGPARRILKKDVPIAFVEEQCELMNRTIKL